jgi:hypothetical protein
VYFHENSVAGKVEEGFNSSSNDFKKENLVILQCFPLYSILLAVGKTKVDYFSLDVEGSETQILKTVPWHRVDIKVIINRCFQMQTNMLLINKPIVVYTYLL